MKYLTWGLGGLSTVLLVILLMKSCSNSSPGIVNISDTGSSPTRTLAQDNLKVRQQELLIVQSKGTIEALQDSIERITEKLTKVIPQYLIRYRDTIVYKDKPLVIIRDTSYSPLDSLVIVQKRFRDSSGWYNIQGAFTEDTVHFNRLEFYNKTSVIIGQKGSWWQPQTIVVNVAQDNPYLTTGSIQSYYYKPKERKWTLVAGPSLLFNGKTFYKGIAITAGYKVY